MQSHLATYGMAVAPHHLASQSAIAVLRAGGSAIEAMVAAASVVFDVVALPPETPVIKLAQQLGKKTISGAEVIALQAVEQFAMYTGVRPDDELIAEAAEFARAG